MKKIIRQILDDLKQPAQDHTFADSNAPKQFQPSTHQFDKHEPNSGNHQEITLTQSQPKPEDLGNLGEDPRFHLQPYLRLLDLAYPVDDLLLSVRDMHEEQMDIVSNVSLIRAPRKRGHRAALPRACSTSGSSATTSPTACCASRGASTG